jgi:metal-sulfur cluster biosynthetic enzyme
MAPEAAGTGDRPSEDAVLEALKEVVDPEIGLNIVDLGLVYDLEVDREGTVAIEMTLTTPGCPLHAAINDAVHRALQPLPGVRGVELDLVWSPPWTPEMITPAGRRALGWAEH